MASGSDAKIYSAGFFITVSPETIDLASRVNRLTRFRARTRVYFDRTGSVCMELMSFPTLPIV